MSQPCRVNDCLVLTAPLTIGSGPTLLSASPHGREQILVPDDVPCLVVLEARRFGSEPSQGALGAVHGPLSKQSPDFMDMRNCLLVDIGLSESEEGRTLDGLRCRLGIFALYAVDQLRAMQPCDGRLDETGGNKTMFSVDHS
jgi:hypothetical protein